MRFPLSHLLTLGISLSPLATGLSTATGPSEAVLESKGQCYSYFDNQVYNITTALQPCKEFCTNTTTYTCVSPGNQTQVPPSLIYVDSNGSEWTPGACACNWATKQVIPDLTSLGYTLTKEDDQTTDYFEIWDIKYRNAPQILIDSLGFPLASAAQYTGAILITEAWNQGHPFDSDHPGDLNPNKRPLRDILLSFWQSKTGRSVSELYDFKYDTVVEASMVAAVPRAYAAMGKTLDEKEEETGSLMVARNGGREGELEAFEILMSTVFAIGITKLSLEYEEFTEKRIESFWIRWEYGLLSLDIHLAIPSTTA